jgi:hypothetical protein
MLSRRTFLSMAGAAAMGRGSARAASEPTVRTPVNFEVPPGACDSHVHVIPDPAQFPFWSGRVYTPPVDTADDLLALQQSLHLDRVVIVTPSVYGTDNSATLDGIKKLGLKRARGVAVTGADASKAQSSTPSTKAACAAFASTWSRAASRTPLSLAVFSTRP